MGEKATWDPTTRKFKVEKVEGNGNNNSKTRYVSYHCGERPDSTEEELNTLLKYAKEDGFDLSGDTDKGKKAREGKVVKQYIRIAIQDLIANRGQAAQEVKSKGKG